jgi:hypothetical protein
MDGLFKYLSFLIFAVARFAHTKSKIILVLGWASRSNLNNELFQSFKHKKSIKK